MENKKIQELKKYSKEQIKSLEEQLKNYKKPSLTIVGAIYPDSVLEFALKIANNYDKLISGLKE